MIAILFWICSETCSIFRKSFLSVRSLIYVAEMKNCRESLIKCNIDLNLADSVFQKTDSYKELFNFAKDLIFDPHFWVDVDYLCSILVPIILIVILRFSDNSYTIPVGFIGLV